MDYAVGASFIVNTAILLEYLLRIENRIKYAEDYSYVMMVAEGRNIEFVDRPIVFYEFGIGVSTNGQSVWQQRIRHDNQVGLQLIWPYLTIAEKNERKSNRNVFEKVLRYILTPRLILDRFGLLDNEVNKKTFLEKKDYLRLQSILRL